LTKILELSSKIAPLNTQIAALKASLASLMASIPAECSMEVEEGEEERAEGGSIFEELDTLTVGIYKLKFFYSRLLYLIIFFLF
jgi:uncharacterized small protein (DUF1192 family)